MLSISKSNSECSQLRKLPKVMSDFMKLHNRHNLWKTLENLYMIQAIPEPVTVALCRGSRHAISSNIYWAAGGRSRNVRTAHPASRKVRSSPIGMLHVIDLSPAGLYDNGRKRLPLSEHGLRILTVEPAKCDAWAHRHANAASCRGW